MPDLMTLILLLLVVCFSFYSLYRTSKKDIFKEDYYEIYRSLIGYITLPIIIIFLLIFIFDKLFNK